MRSAGLALLLAAPALAGCGGDGYPQKPQQVAKACGRGGWRVRSM